MSFYDHLANCLVAKRVCVACIVLMTCGCGPLGKPDTNRVGLGTNQVGLVSIGLLETVDVERQKAVMRFFASNGVACGIEGTITYNVMVQAADVERARTILQSNPPPDIAFHSAWEKR